MNLHLILTNLHLNSNLSKIFKKSTIGPKWSLWRSVWLLAATAQLNKCTFVSVCQSVCLSVCPSQNWISPCFVPAWSLFDAVHYISHYFVHYVVHYAVQYAVHYAVHFAVQCTIFCTLCSTLCCKVYTIKNTMLSTLPYIHCAAD